MDEVTPKPESIRAALAKLTALVRPKVAGLYHEATDHELRLPPGMSVDHRILCIALEMQLAEARRRKSDLEILVDLMPIIKPEIKAYRALEEALKVIDNSGHYDAALMLSDIRTIICKALGKP